MLNLRVASFTAILLQYVMVFNVIDYFTPHVNKICNNFCQETYICSMHTDLAIIFTWLINTLAMV